MLRKSSKRQDLLGKARNPNKQGSMYYQVEEAQIDGMACLGRSMAKYRIQVS